MSDATNQNVNPQERGNRRVETGVVTSDKMDKTRRVEIPRLVKHARYGKYIKRRTICHIHDERNESQTGDTVEIMKPGRCRKPRHGGCFGLCPRRPKRP